jgi:Recombination endonuclease VII
MTERDKYLLKRYGITETDYNTMLRKQNYKCALCKKHRNKFKKRLAVEHNHRTGKIRALACFYCNKMRIGRNDLKSARELYEYMQKYDG